MARTIHKLTAREVETETKPGRLSDGGGLYLFISPDGRRRWTFMYTWRGKQREAGLGRAPEKKAQEKKTSGTKAKESQAKDVVSLKAARDKAAEGRAFIKAGLDPISEWNKPDPKKAPTFGEAADDFLAAHKDGWRNDKHKAQWTMTLTTYCEAIRKTPIDEIDTEAVLSVLKPLWTRAPETASRLRGRIETVLDAAKARGFIGQNEANPARWRGHLDKLLPKRGKLARGHHAAMPYADVPAFVVGLRERPATAARALEFAILTATRSGETLAARWDEFDLDGKSGRSRPGRRRRRASIASRFPIAPSSS